MIAFISFNLLKCYPAFHDRNVTGQGLPGLRGTGDEDIFNRKRMNINAIRDIVTHVERTNPTYSIILSVQECDPTFLEMAELYDWVALPRDAPRTYEQFVFGIKGLKHIKLLGVTTRPIDRNKNITVVRLESNGFAFALLNCHLDYAKKGFGILKSIIDGEGRCLIMGDFNEGIDGPNVSALFKMRDFLVPDNSKTDDRGREFTHKDTEQQLVVYDHIIKVK